MAVASAINYSNGHRFTFTNRTVATRSEFVVPECGGIVLVGDGGR